jgi:hypothetical protein
MATMKLNDGRLRFRIERERGGRGGGEGEGRTGGGERGRKKNRTKEDGEKERKRKRRRDLWEILERRTRDIAGYSDIFYRIVRLSGKITRQLIIVCTRRNITIGLLDLYFDFDVR